MTEILSMFSYPFMQRAFIAGAILGLMLASLGVIAVLRRMSFFADGVAHASIAGIAIAIFSGLAPLPFAIAWAIVVSLTIYFLERYTKLASDALIGILFTTSMALGVIIMSRVPGFQPELLSYLFGSILSIQTLDLGIIAASGVIILSWFFLNLKSLTYAALSEESARAYGVNTGLQHLLFYLFLGITVVLGVKIIGIILVSALMILPAAIGQLLAKNFKAYVLIAVLVSEVIIFSGLAFSYLYDLPSGAAIVLAGGLLFMVAALLKPQRV